MSDNSNNNGSTYLSTNLKLNSRQYRAQDREILTFTLTNNSNESVSVLKWQTPLEGIRSDMFWVRKQEEIAVYLGRMVKRGAPKPEDYVTLDPRESISIDFDLAEVYDISKAGNYTVEFDSRILDLGTRKPKALATRLSKTRKFSTQKVRSNIVEFSLLEDRNAKQSQGVALEWSQRLSALAAEVPEFRACTTNQRNLLEDTLKEAEKIAKESRGILSNTPEIHRPNARRYKEWFGGYIVVRYDKVKSNFDKIVNAIENEKIVFNCSMEDCGSESTFAYVYPARPYEIFLCNAFWNARLTGANSKAGTVVHELSHFNVVAGTDDNEYGQAACRQLARDSPEEAIANADSHEYFAENTPRLSM
jgi:peptidyl-Lys metalloendopeptidase